MDDTLPEKSVNNSENGDSGSDNGDAKFIAIRDFHYYGNDLSELRKIAEVSPELAEKVIDQRDRESTRVNISYRFGVASSVVLVSVVLIAMSYILVNVGVLSTVSIIIFILAIALLLRVILTGEWSDTSWFGKFVGLLAKALGSGKDQE